MPAPWENADVSALKALARGVANEGQQKRAINYILGTLSGTYEHTYVPGPGGERDTAFANGRRYVGLQIVKLVNLPPEQLKKTKEGQNG